MNTFSLDDVRDSFEPDINGQLDVARDALVVCRGAREERTAEGLAARADVLERLARDAAEWSGRLGAQHGVTAGAVSRFAFLCAEGAATWARLARLVPLEERLVEVATGGIDRLRAALEHELAKRANEAAATTKDLVAELDLLLEEPGWSELDAEGEEPALIIAGDDANGADPLEGLAELLTSVRASVGRFSELGDDTPDAEARGRLVIAMHAIAGTASLVEVTSLSIPARRIEALSERCVQIASTESAARAATANLLGAFQQAAERLLDAAEMERDGDADAASELLAADVLAWSAEEDGLAGRVQPPESAAADHGDEEFLNMFGAEEEPVPEEASEDTFAFAAEPSSPEVEVGPAVGADPAEAPPEVDPELLEIFQAEAEEVRAGLEASLAALDSDPADSEQLHVTERLFHQIKGAAAMLGLEAIAERAKVMEYAFADQVEGGGPAAQELLERARGELAFLVGAAAATAESTAQTEEATQPVELAPAAAISAEPRRVELSFETDPMLWDAFGEEARELLEGLERGLIALESTGGRAPLEELMRCFHTLKGGLNTLGLDPLGAEVHCVEDGLERALARDGDVHPSGWVALLSAVGDDVRAGLKSAPGGSVAVRTEWVAARIEALLSEEPLTAQAPVVQAQASAGASAEEGRILRVPAERLDELMNLVGELVTARSRMDRRVAALAVLEDELQDARSRLLGKVRDFVDRYEYHGLAGQRIVSARSRAALVGVGAGVAAPEGGPSGHGFESGAGHGVVAEGPRNGSRDDGQSGDDGHAGEIEQLFSELELDRYEDVNILARSLNEINDDLSAVARQIGDELERFGEDSAGFGTVISGMQDRINQARMVPAEQLFLRLRRPVRDAAQREGKQVRVVTHGDRVTLDKTILDEVYSPMLHLVRNAVSHGIEDPAGRTAAGKDEVGTITLAARQESGHIVVEVTDDGPGLDLTALRDKGVARGLLPEDCTVSDPRVPELIFASGLSTREQVSDVSGRGVGCDVVRREIERIGGHVAVETRAGRGTTFRLTLPLTVAIYRALIVEVGGRAFALPLAFVERAYDARECAFGGEGAARVLETESERLAVRCLADELQLPSTPGRGWRDLVVMRFGGQGLGLEVDEVLGLEEIVVKPLGDLLGGHPLFSGATQAHDGTPILILDTPGLFDAASASVFAASTSDILDDEAEEADDAAFAFAAESDAPQGPLEVLYVDDSLSVRKAAEKFLRNAGVDVTLAVDGMDALNKLRERSFDLVFTDLEMPRMHGYDLIREVRFLPRHADLPLIVVTSRSSDKHRAQAKKLGANGYITKPFHQGNLEDMLIQHLGARREGGHIVRGGGLP